MEIKDRLINDILSRAQNNKDREAMINPTDYGFESKTEGTSECLKIIKCFEFVEKADKTDCKNLLKIIVKKEYI